MADGAALLGLVPIAIAFGLSPVPLVELILVLFSRRRVVNSVAFIVSLMGATALAVAVGAAGGQASGDTAAGPSTIVSVVLLLLGLLLLVIGVRNWRNRADESEPKILSTIYEMGLIPVAVIAIGVSLFNPKNLTLLLAAGATIGATPAPLLFGLGFLIVATLPYLIPTLYSLLGGERAAVNLDRMRAWLIAKNRLILGIVCMILGVLLSGRSALALLT